MEPYLSNVQINGVDYVRAAQSNGNRAVVVVDRGWIFAGDVTMEDGRITAGDFAFEIDASGLHRHQRRLWHGHLFASPQQKG